MRPGFGKASTGVVAGLEEALGDPHDPAGVVTFRRRLAADEAESLESEAVDFLRGLGLSGLLVPHRDGGALGSPEDVLWAGRMVARRDMTLALTFGSTLLGAMPVWLWGTAGQRDRLARAILDGALGGFAISEADHGSDLLGSQTTLDRGGSQITGEKWPVGNATRGRFCTVLAKAAPGASTFTLLCLFKDDLAPGSWTHTPGVPLLGLRGFDLSGIRFAGTSVPPDARIGQAHEGIQQTLKTLQVTRTMLAGFSLGSGDSALRLALDHVRARTLYGAPVYDLPEVRRRLTECYLDLIIAECVARPAFRALSVRPARLSLWSAVTKALVPALVNDVMSAIGEVLGARKFLRCGPWHGMFQKLWRDHSVVDVFDGTAQVCLRAVAGQIPAVTGGADIDASEAGETLAGLFSLTTPPPLWVPDGGQLQLTNRGVDEIWQTWRSALRRVEAGPDLPAKAAIMSLCLVIDEYRQSLRGHDQTPDIAARLYCLLFAAAACLHTWLVNDEQGDAEFRSGDWLIGCLSRLVARIRPFEYAGVHGEGDMLARYTAGRMFSLVPVDVAGAQEGR